MGIGAGQAYLEKALLVSFSPAPLASVSPGVAAWGVFFCPFLFAHSPPRCRPPTRKELCLSSAQWDPAAAWRRRPGAYPVQVSELELTHAQLVKADGWKNVFQQWAPRLLDKSSADRPAPEATGIDPAHADPAH